MAVNMGRRVQTVLVSQVLDTLPHLDRHQRSSLLAVRQICIARRVHPRPYLSTLVTTRSQTRSCCVIQAPSVRLKRTGGGPGAIQSARATLTGAASLGLVDHFIRMAQPALCIGTALFTSLYIMTATRARVLNATSWSGRGRYYAQKVRIA